MRHQRIILDICLVSNRNLNNSKISDITKLEEYIPPQSHRNVVTERIDHVKRIEVFRISDVLVNYIDIYILRIVAPFHNY